MIILACTTHYLELCWQTRSFGDTSPVQDMSGNHKVAFPFCKSRQVHGGCHAGWILIFPVREETIPLGCMLRSCESSQPPLESNLEGFTRGLKSGLSLTGGAHSSRPLYHPEVWWTPTSRNLCICQVKQQDGGRSSWVVRAHKTWAEAGGAGGQTLMFAGAVLLEQYCDPTGLQNKDWAFGEWITKADKPHLLRHKMEILWERGKIKKKRRKKMKQDGYGGVGFSQGKGAFLRVPGLLLISVRVFGFQPSPAPISQSLPPQENACCLPRHSSHTTGTAGRVFRLWHRWDTQHLLVYLWWLIPTSPRLPPPSLNGFIWFWSWRHLAERSRHFLWFASKALQHV